MTGLKAGHYTRLPSQDTNHAKQKTEPEAPLDVI